jgi:hypothetical protein
VGGWMDGWKLVLKIGYSNQEVWRQRNKIYKSQIDQMMDRIDWGTDHVKQNLFEGKINFMRSARPKQA